MSEYKVGDKFVVEIGSIFKKDNLLFDEELYRIKGFNSIVFDKNGLDKLQKYEETAPIPYSIAYNKGLNDAWELARKLHKTKPSELWKMFTNKSSVLIIRDNSPQETLAKLEAYEKEQEQICVGDVVESTVNNKKYLVIEELKDDEWDFSAFDVKEMNIIRINATSRKSSGERYFKKTGKHIDIHQILEQIGE